MKVYQLNRINVKTRMHHVNIDETISVLDGFVSR